MSSRTYCFRPCPPHTGPYPPPPPSNASCTRQSAPSTTPAQISPAQCHPKYSRPSHIIESDPTSDSFRRSVPTNGTPPYSCITPQKQAAWGRMSGRLHLQKPLRRTLYQPAPYLRRRAPSMQNLFCLRTQAWAHRIPSHLHYGKDRVRIPYDHHYCPSPNCPRPQTLGCLSGKNMPPPIAPPSSKHCMNTYSVSRETTAVCPLASEPTEP